MNRIQTLGMTVVATLVVAVSVTAQATALALLTVWRLELPNASGPELVGTSGV